MTVSFAKTLIRWYRRNARRLPWRETRDHYKIWISEVMLQQTTVSAVVPFYHKWMNEFPSVGDVERAPLEKVLKAWEGLGYYARARNIHAAAQMIVERHAGRVPRDPGQLRALPGFGPYTTGAVLSIAYDLRSVIIDANVRRVFMRVLAMKGQAVPARDPAIRTYLEKIMPDSGPGEFNQALMELGALICRSRSPLCIQCPVKGSCKAYEKGVQEIIPLPRKLSYKDLDVVIGVLKKGRKYFIQKRPPTGLLAGLWEFPGGKVKEGESRKEALARELKEECGIEITACKHFMDTVHFYTNHRVKLFVYLCRAETYPEGTENARWVSRKELARYPMPSGSAKIVAGL